MHGAHMMRFISATQATIALSVGESEWHGLVHGSSALLGFRALALDYGRTLTSVIRTDSTTAIGIGARRGVGKIRHLSTRTLWVQQRITKKELKVTKVDGTENIADLGTKLLERSLIDKFVGMMGFVYRSGKSLLAKEIV